MEILSREELLTILHKARDIMVIAEEEFEGANSSPAFDIPDFIAKKNRKAEAFRLLEKSKDALFTPYYQEESLYEDRETFIFFWYHAFAELNGPIGTVVLPIVKNMKIPYTNYIIWMRNAYDNLSIAIVNMTTEQNSDIYNKDAYDAAISQVAEARIIWTKAFEDAYAAYPEKIRSIRPTNL